MIRKILQLASYVFAVAAAVLGALSLVVFLNLKSELLELVNITNYNTFVEFDNAFRSKYLVFGGFAISALSALVCLLVIVIGRSEVIKFVYIDKPKPEWVPGPNGAIQKQSSALKAGFILESFFKNFNSSLHIEHFDENQSKECRMFNAICIATNAAAGICYIPTSDGENLKQTSTFAILENNFKERFLPINSGILGQAASDLKYKIFNNVPSKYLNIETAVGSLLPATLLIFPFSDINNGKCTMVVELAFFLEIDQAIVDALFEINHQIAGNLVPLEAQD
ncbi:MAG: hypothetical protein ACOVMN_10530 [Flexibacteraceae bacterium]